MDFTDFLGNYVRAWNRQDFLSWMKFLSNDAGYYDSFFNANVVRRDLAAFLSDDFDTVRVHFDIERIVIVSDRSAWYTYDAELRTAEAGHCCRFRGTEFLSLRGGKIQHITDIYTAPAPLLSAYYGAVAQTRDDDERQRLLTDVLECRLEVSRLLQDTRAYQVPGYTLELLAAKTGIDAATIETWLRLETGSTFEQFLDDYRAKKARNLIDAQQEWPVEGAGPSADRRIARKVGFASMDAFVTAFQRNYGQLPAEYRASLGERCTVTGSRAANGPSTDQA